MCPTTPADATLPENRPNEGAQLAAGVFSSQIWGLVGFATCPVVFVPCGDLQVLKTARLASLGTGERVDVLPSASKHGWRRRSTPGAGTPQRCASCRGTGPPRRRRRRTRRMASRRRRAPARTSATQPHEYPCALRLCDTSPQDSDGVEEEARRLQTAHLTSSAPHRTPPHRSKPSCQPQPRPTDRSPLLR